MEDLHCWQSKFTPCNYSDKLLRKITLLNQQATAPVDIFQIKKAIYYAKKYHGNQKRDSGEPFYSHPLAVAELMSDYMFTTDLLITSILHDTIEDTALTKEHLNCIFSTTIAEQVNDLSRIKFNKKISVTKNINSLFEQKKENLLLIKLIDRLHNLQTIDAKHPERQKAILLETAQEFMILAIYLNQSKIENSLLQILTKKLKPKLDLLQLQYCQKTFYYNFQTFSLSTQNAIG